MARALGLDVGDRRIGVALSDPTGMLATPLAAIDRRAAQGGLETVARLARENEAAAVVVGMPLSLDGSAGPQARAVQSFIAALRDVCPLPVHTVNEQYTSAEAERRLRDVGVEPSREPGRVDALAAAIILQEWLDAAPRGGQAGGAP